MKDYLKDYKFMLKNGKYLPKEHLMRYMSAYNISVSDIAVQTGLRESSLATIKTAGQKAQFRVQTALKIADIISVASGTPMALLKEYQKQGFFIAYNKTNWHERFGTATQFTSLSQYDYAIDRILKNGFMGIKPLMETPEKPVVVSISEVAKYYGVEDKEVIYSIVQNYHPELLTVDTTEEDEDW